MTQSGVQVQAEAEALEAEAAAAAATTEAVVAEEATREGEAAAAAAALEARARVFGWKAKEEFDRPPERWVDAATYLARQETNLPVLKENLHRLEGMFGSTKAELEALRADNAGLSASVGHLRELAISAETRAYERARRDIEAKRDTAAATADVAGVRAASDELAQLRPPPVAPQVRAPERQAAPANDPAEVAAVNDFKSANSWYTADPKAANYAAVEYEDLRRRTDLTWSQKLQEVRKAVSRRFPEHFANERAERPAAVSTPSGAGSGAPRAGANGKWASLPADVRATADKIIADVNKGRKGGKPFTREEYAELYMKSNA